MCCLSNCSLSRLSPVLFFVAALFAAPQAHGQATWLSTNWSVSCDEDLQQELDPSDCDDTSISGPAAITRAGLEDASVWFRDLGFSRGPHVRYTSGSYLAWISDAETGDDRGVYDPTERRLTLNSTYYFAMGTDGTTEEELERSRSTDATYTSAMVHELFHALQYRYHRGTTYYSAEHDWIWEGMAEAVAYAWLDKTQPEEELIPAVRVYDYSLHEPRLHTEDGEQVCYDCYSTSEFWLWLGERLEAVDRIDYLRYLLEQDLKPDRGLQGIHEGLKQWNEKGLYDLFPAFVASSLRSPRFFTDNGREELRLPYRDEQVSGERQGEVRPVAANAYEVTVPIPDGEVAGLKIEFTEDHEDLHLIVDTLRYDRPVTIDEERNVFRRALAGQAEPHELFVRVVNVGPEPVDTESRSYTLRFTLTPITACKGEEMWIATHPAIRERAQLLPPEEYERRHPDHHVTVGELRISGLVDDGGVTCTHPAGIGTNPDAPVAEMQQWGEQMREQIEEMSQEELMEMAQRMQDAMGSGRTPDQTIQDVLEATEESGLDSLPNKSTLIRIFSPNALSWQQHLRSGIPSPTSIQQALQKDDPVVPYDHAGIGGWLANSGLDLSLIILDADLDELREDSTYEARATLGYRRGEGKIVKSRRSTAGPGHPGYSAAWQPLEGWREELGPDGSSGSPWMMRGTVTIEEVTGATIRGRFELSGMGRWMRAECPNNPLNRLGIRRRCSDEERSGAVSVSGWFEAPATDLYRDP